VKTVALAALKSYFSFLVENGVRLDHPCRNITTRVKKKPIQTQDLFTIDELEILIERENRYYLLDLRNKAIISMMIYQALSSAELCRLQCMDIDLAEGLVFIRGSKKISARKLLLLPKQVLILHDYIQIKRPQLLRRKNDSLFLTKIGQAESVTGIHSIIEPLKNLYPDRKLTPSTIRQSVITNKLNVAGEALEQVQLFAGHKWPSTTEKYVRSNTEESQRRINMWHPLAQQPPSQ
jgi:site-specific recombinase XerD